MPSTSPKAPLHETGLMSADLARHSPADLARHNPADLARHNPADLARRSPPTDCMEDSPTDLMGHSPTDLMGHSPAAIMGHSPADLMGHSPADLTHSGIVTVQEATKHLNAARAQGKTIVFTNGCFDILHPGHVDLLARAKALGDILILGLNTDASVQRLNKGPKRPINTYAARAFLAIHLASVDFVTCFDEDTPLQLITALMPDILIKGGDWALETIIGHELVLARGGKVYSLPLLGQYSTTKLVHRLQATHEKML